MAQRSAKISRDTHETKISVELQLDGQGSSDIKTGVPFLDHMLDQVARHGLMDLQVLASGDLHIDAHHTVEDVGITFGQAMKQAMGGLHGIRRYASVYIPLDEALSRVVIDISGRPGLFYFTDYPRARIGDFDVDLIREFFQGFVNHALWTIHIDQLRGVNAHHIAESIFKAFARAAREAISLDPRIAGRIPSTKGSL